MHRKIRRLLRPLSAFLLTALFLVVCGVTTAKNGRDFAGVYHIRQRTDLGDAVRIEFTASIQNFGDADVYGATAVMHGNLHSGPRYWRSPSILLRGRESTVLQGVAIVPRLEVEQWDRGAPPRLYVEWTDQQGRGHRGNVELHRGVIPTVR